MQKLKILTLGCNSILGFNFTKNILKNKKIIFYGTINKNSYRLNTDPLTRKFSNIKKYNPILHSKKLIKILNNFQPDIVINFIGSSDLFIKSKKEHDSQNFNTLKNIFNSINLSNTNIKHFFNMGSAQEYRNSLKSVKESYSLNPITDYAKSKVKCHKYGVKWGTKNNIKFTTLRVFNVIGNDQFKKNIFIKLIRLKPNEKIVLHQFNAVRDYIFIKDFISILIKLILNYNKVNYNVINIGAGVPITMSYLIKSMSRLLKRDLINNIIINNKLNTHSNSNYANIDRLKKIIHIKKLKSVDEILKILIKNNDKLNNQ